MAETNNILKCIISYIKNDEYNQYNVDDFIFLLNENTAKQIVKELSVYNCQKLVQTIMTAFVNEYIDEWTDDYILLQTLPIFKIMYFLDKETTLSYYEQIRTENYLAKHILDDFVKKQKLKENIKSLEFK
jgi:hypothetical protein